jgi:RNA polymerase sigma-70 factor (ECF subfamily)
MPGSPALDDLDDDALVRRTLAGHRDAFGGLVARYQGRLVAICGQITGDYDQAADLAQEAFLRAYTNLERYQPGRSFFAWLYRIAVNGALNYRNRRPPAPVRGQPGAAALLAAPDPAPSPEAHAEQADLAHQVQAAIAQLPAEYAAVLALRYGADLDYAAIAATLDVPLGTVKIRLFRAKALLRPLLATLDEEGEP